MSENVMKTKEQDGRKPGEDYRDADGILVCGKCGEPRERMFPAGGIFKEPHLVPTMCRCQREEADRQREEAERAEKRRRTERLRKQCFPSSGRYAFCTFDAEYVMEHVYDVIDGRYKAGKPMVITTNFDFRERILNATADDPWGRVFDRIVEVGFPVKYDGNSRRREIGMKNRKDFKRKLGIEGIES